MLLALILQNRATEMLPGNRAKRRLVTCIIEQENELEDTISGRASYLVD